jgi:hypothetical protein
MYKIAFYFFILIFSFSSYAGDYAVMTNFTFKKGKTNFSYSLINEKEQGHKYDITNKINSQKGLNYSGYKNVEGFKNTKRKDDITFASLVTGGGFLILLTGAATVIAVASAL